ncbi:MAG: hypothetical protein Fur0022_40820 [Anaerolineales bacterium]
MVELIALKCFKCETPIPAAPDEIAWVCQRCGQGLMLDEVKGVASQAFHFAAGIQPGKKGSPFWVVGGNLRLNRQTYASFSKKDDEAAAFWSVPRQFFIPAYACTLEAMVEAGVALLRNPPRLSEGGPAPFLPVTVAPQDIYPLAEFIVLAIEAERKDNIKQIDYSLELRTPELWVLP